MTVDAAVLCCCGGVGQPPGPCCYCSASLAGLSLSVQWTGNIDIIGNASFACFQQNYPGWQQYCNALGNNWLNWRSGVYNASARAVQFSSTSCTFTHSTFQESITSFDSFGLTSTCVPFQGFTVEQQMRRARYTLTPPKGACPGAVARNYWRCVVELLLFQGSFPTWVSSLSLEFRSAPTWSCTPPQTLSYFPTGLPLSSGCTTLGVNDRPYFVFNVAGGYTITPGQIVIA